MHADLLLVLRFMMILFYQLSYLIVDDGLFAIAISFAVYDNFILLSIIFKGNPKNKSKSACMYGGFYKCIEGRA